MQRVEVLHAYTFLFPRPLDTAAEPVAGARRLMEKRNKFVHSEFSDHTRLKDVYFDGLVPLYGGGPMGQIAEFTARTFLSPGKTDVLREAEVANRFCQYVFEALRPEHRQEIEFMLGQPQLGYNTVKRLYSVPFPSTPFQTVITVPRTEDTGDQAGTPKQGLDTSVETAKS